MGFVLAEIAPTHKYVRILYVLLKKSYFLLMAKSVKGQITDLKKENRISFIYYSLPLLFVC